MPCSDEGLRSVSVWRGSSAFGWLLDIDITVRRRTVPEAMHALRLGRYVGRDTVLCRARQSAQNGLSVCYQSYKLGIARQTHSGYHLTQIVDTRCCQRGLSPLSTTRIAIAAYCETQLTATPKLPSKNLTDC